MCVLLRTLLIGVSFSVTACPVCRAAVIVVDQAGGGDFTEIQPALDAAQAGDQIRVMPGEYVISVPINFRGNALRLYSESGPQVTTIRMAKNRQDPKRASVVIFESGETEESVLEGFTLTGGRGSKGLDGGGVYCYRSSPTLINCTITGNSAHSGGGVFCVMNSSPVLTNCTISGNSAVFGGGVFCYNSSPVITNCIVWDNAGGSIYIKQINGDSSNPQVTFSCIEGKELWPGEGNINADPLFCGWPSDEVWVSDQQGLKEALSGFDLSLSAGSPCLGTGKDGSDMGSMPRGCETQGSVRRLVRLEAGTYDIRGLVLTHRLSIVGRGENRTTLEGTVWGLRTGCLLSDLKVTKGNQSGIVVSPGEAPEIANCMISGNSTQRRGYGGGVLCYNSSPVITNCTILGNSAVYEGGGVFCYNSSPVITNCTISRNSAVYVGGGIYCGKESSPALTNCIISGNWAVYNGGGLGCLNSSPSLTKCTISGNSASAGGGIYCGGNSVLINCTISGNAAVSGGGVFCSDCSPVVITNCIIWDNAGGSIYLRGGDSNLHVSFSCIEGEQPWPGEGNINTDPLFCGWPSDEIWVSDQQGLEEALSEFNYSLSAGSPCLGTGKDGSDMGSMPRGSETRGSVRRFVHLEAGTYDIRGLLLTHWVSIVGRGENKTTLEGTVWGLRTGSLLSDLKVTKGNQSGIVVSAGEAPEIANCMISGNSTQRRGYGGGVLCYNSSPVITNCTISGNNSAEGGGGVYCYKSLVTLLNCTISGNSASGYGGGLGCDNSAPTLINCTISGNSAEYRSGGVHCGWDSSPTLTNCIVWDNLGGSIYLISERSSNPKVSFSCIEGEELWPGEGNINSDPLFVQPGHWHDNGTPDNPWDDIWIEGDYHLKPGSPCIDSGTSQGAPSFDIEGNSRPCGEGVDMGAYEAGNCFVTAVSFLRGYINSDRKLNIADAIFVLQYLLAGGEAPRCLKAADSNDSGSLEVADAVYLLGYLFAEGAEPPPPFSACGPDPTPDELTCEAFEICEGW